MENKMPEKSTHYRKFGWNRFLIVFYAVLLMILAPILVFIFYIAYMYAWDMEFIRHRDREIKKAIVTDKSKWKSQEKSNKED